MYYPLELGRSVLYLAAMYSDGKWWAWQCLIIHWPTDSLFDSLLQQEKEPQQLFKHQKKDGQQFAVHIHQMKADGLTVVWVPREINVATAFKLKMGSLLTTLILPLILWRTIGTLEWRNISCFMGVIVSMAHSSWNTFLFPLLRIKNRYFFMSHIASP